MILSNYVCGICTYVQQHPLSSFSENPNLDWVNDKASYKAQYYFPELHSLHTY